MKTWNLDVSKMIITEERKLVMPCLLLKLLVNINNLIVKSLGLTMLTESYDGTIKLWFKMSKPKDGLSLTLVTVLPMFLKLITLPAPVKDKIQDL